MPEASTEATPQAPSLTIADLVLTAQIIQAAAGKGVFRAEELKTIGDYYDRLISFLESSGAITKNQSADSAPAPAPEDKQEKPNAKTRRKA